MSRSGFLRVAHDFYATTDPRAVAALAPHLAPGTRFIEPCAGDGALVRQLVALGLHCVEAFDIAPRDESVREGDALIWQRAAFDHPAVIITNPPYRWDMLAPMIRHFIRQENPAWLLLEAGFAYTRRAQPLMVFCHEVQPVGRLKWFPGSAHGSVKDYAWYHFQAEPNDGFAAFYPRPVVAA
ncbi:MAG: class I SAM-dependent methyltransferase [Paracoccaceae bacterium]